MDEENRNDLRPGLFSREYSYEGIKGIIRNNLENVARAFVTTGYYLRLVAEKRMFLADGYVSLEEFAQEEYGMGASWVNRCIKVNERFSEDGYSPKIADPYKGYSKSQLTEMLPMSDEQLEQVTSDMTIKEIRKLKRSEAEEDLGEIPNQMRIEDFPEFMPESESTTDIKEEVFPILEALPVEKKESSRRCITGKSDIGICGAASYCSVPVDCCAACEEDCNIRCGWLPGKLELEGEDPILATSQKSEILEICEKEMDQAELPPLKNNEQRMAFIDGYLKWPLWIDLKETGERYYRYSLPDGVFMVVKIYHCMLFDCGMSLDVPWKERFHEGWGRAEYYLLQSGKFFHDCKTNKSGLIEYLKEVQKK